jgi:hypothetical protein
LLEIGDEQGLHGIREAYMNRELALKIVLALVGLLFLALVFPLAMFMRREPALSMMLSLYVTLGVFLLLAMRNLLASRSLIAFSAWSSFAHAAVMGTQALCNPGNPHLQGSRCRSRELRFHFESFTGSGNFQASGKYSRSP